jgi:hypothetical protein
VRWIEGVPIVKSLRRYLRPIAMAWLVSQAVSLSALAGFDCCAAHRAPGPEAKAAQPADGAPCPMHAASARSDAPPASDHQNPTKCVMRGACRGPMAALLVFLSNNGIPPESIATTPGFVATAAPRPSPETFAVHFESPDPPPPRV